MDLFPELLIIFGVFNFNIYLGVIAALSVIIGASYMLWMFQRAILQDRPEGSAELRYERFKNQRDCLDLFHGLF